MSDYDLESLESDESWPLLARFRQYGAPHAGYLAVGLSMVFLGQVRNSAVTFVFGVAIDGIFNAKPYRLPLLPDGWIPTEPIPQLWFTALVLGILYGLNPLMFYFGNYARGTFSHLVRYDLKMDLYDTVQRLEMAFFDAQQTGEIMSILNNDVDSLRQFFHSSVGSVVNSAGALSSMAVFMFLLNPQLMVIAFAVSPAVAYAMHRFGDRIEAVQHRVRRAIGRLNARFEDNVSGIEVIKANATEPYESERVADAAGETFRTNWDATKVRARYQPVWSVLSNGTYVLTFVVGGYWVLQGPPAPLGGTLTAGELVPFLIYTQSLVGWFGNLAGPMDTYKSAKAAARRVAKIQRTDVRIDESPDAATLDDVAGAVAYDDVTFGYGDDPVLDGVRLDVPPGETVGIVGPTGAGKSTLLKLLLRFYDVDGGAVRVDGHDVRDVTLQSLRDAIGYVSQEPYLFPGTVRENIAYGADVDDEAVCDAARAANAHAFVAALPDGYETEVGERGASLSGGQRQRLAIARAVVRDPAIMLFDEATSHVDNETEVLIQHSVRETTADRTTFVVAHRLSTVRDADRIVVLDDGEVVERGTHDELLERDGLYATLWGVQVGRIDAGGSAGTGTN